MNYVEFDPIAQLPRELSEADIGFVRVPDLTYDDMLRRRTLALELGIR